MSLICMLYYPVALCYMQYMFHHVLEEWDGNQASEKLTVYSDNPAGWLTSYRFQSQLAGAGLVDWLTSMLNYVFT